MTQHGPEQHTADVRTPSASDQARGVTQELRGTARDVAQEARAAGSSLRDEATGLGSTLKQGLSDQVERQKNGIADRLSSVAERAQKTADDLQDNEAWLGNLVARGAAELREVAEEVRRNDVAGILGSVEVFARRQPALFMGAAVALGFAMTRIATGGLSTDERDRQPAAGGRYDDQRYGSRPGEFGARGAEAPVVAGSNI